MISLLVGQVAIAGYLGVSTRTLRRWMAAPDPPPVQRVHGVWYASSIALDRWILER